MRWVHRVDPPHADFIPPTRLRIFDNREVGLRSYVLRKVRQTGCANDAGYALLAVSLTPTCDVPEPTAAL
jgi:hypothetical protein